MIGALSVACRSDDSAHGDRRQPQQPATAETSDTGEASAEETGSISDTDDTAQPAEAVEVCGRAVAPVAPVQGRRLVGTVIADEAWWRSYGVAAEETLGFNGAAGDFDGDGHVDLAVDHIYHDWGVSVFFGPLLAGSWPEPDVAAYAVVPPPESLDFSFGLSDVDADGTTELLFYSLMSGNYSWEVLDLLPGPAGLIETSALPPPQATLDLTPWDLGTVPALLWSPAADVDLDGQPDLWMTAADGALGESYVKLLPGPIVGTRDPLLESIAAYETFVEGGYQTYLPEGYPDHDVLAVGNYDGGGSPDLAFAVSGPGPRGSSYGGVVWVYDPPLVMAPIEDVLSAQVDGRADGRLLAIGSGVLTVPDMNGDGYDESAFTAESMYAPGGVVLLQYGPPPAGVFTEECISVTLTDDDPAGQAANEVLTGDLDGDDVPDLVAHGRSTWVWYGPVPTGVGDVVDADAILPGAMPLGVADFDADGFDDMALGNAFTTGVPYLAGEVYVLRGGWE